MTALCSAAKQLGNKKKTKGDRGVLTPVQGWGPAWEMCAMLLQRNEIHMGPRLPSAHGVGPSIRDGSYLVL